MSLLKTTQEVIITAVPIHTLSRFIAGRPTAAFLIIVMLKQTIKLILNHFHTILPDAFVGLFFGYDCDWLGQYTVYDVKASSVTIYMGNGCKKNYSIRYTICIYSYTHDLHEEVQKKKHETSKIFLVSL